MSIQTDFDFLLVGNGIAGSVFALTLQEKGISFLLVDPEETKTSSRIAAGILNPITGRRCAKSWMADTFTPFAIQFYRRQNQLHGSDFFKELPVFRLFSTIKEQNDTLARACQPEFSDYLLPRPDLNRYDEFLDVSLGGVAISGTGYLNTKAWIEAVKIFLSQKGQYATGRVTRSNLTSGEGFWEWEGRTFQKVVLCTGLAAREDGFFEGLPFLPAKGELVTFSCPGFPERAIISKKLFLLPVEKDILLSGSTYEWFFDHEEPTQKGIEEIFDIWQERIKSPIQLLKQEAAARPTVADRRPLLGRHPGLSSVFLFNGLGTKGVLMAPWLADHLLNHIISGTPLLPEVDIQRPVSFSGERPTQAY